MRQLTRERAERILRAIQADGDAATIERIIGPDFIPGGPLVSLDDLEPPQPTDDPTARCCRMVGDDVQSGPIYCGRPAAYRAMMRDRSLGGFVDWCERCVPGRFRKALREAGKETP